ncbi:hypothetical protein RBB78_05215 [Tunturiibacter empetritectus]|uniref:hypothetical protein n=1 Tax=Tunturiibacter empetritectus TaxID=3069691 RepID=UPI003D9BD785
MSTTVTAVGLVGAVAPVTRRVRAYFAPVNRAAGAPTVFDAAHSGTFALSSPPAPWVDLGWCTKFARKSETKIGALTTGAPAVVQSQVVTQVEATLQLEFESWGKLQLALAAGSQQMNLLQTATGAAANGSGGRAAQAVLLTGAAASTATALNVGARRRRSLRLGSWCRSMRTMWRRWDLLGAGLARRMLARRLRWRTTSITFGGFR